MVAEEVGRFVPEQSRMPDQMNYWFRAGVQVSTALASCKAVDTNFAGIDPHGKNINH